MTRLNDIYNAYGKPFSFIAANTYAENVLQASSIISSSMIVAAPYDKESNEDIGQYSLLVTDSYGNPARLTYSIATGNGLDFKDDMVQISIDDNTIKEDNGNLYATLENIIDNNTLSSSEGKVYVDIDNFGKASSSKFGIAKVDNTTIKSDNGTIYVDTSMLDLASGNIAGIASGDGQTISTNGGVATVLSENLRHGSSTSPGIVKADGVTVFSDNGELHTTHEAIAKLRNANGLKMTMPDGATIIGNNGAMSVNENAIPYASPTTYGKVKIDPTTLYVDNNGLLHPRSTESMMSYIYDYNEALDLAEDRISALKEIVENGIMPKEPSIYSLSCNETTATALAMPEHLEEPIDMPVQHVYVSLNLITNCDFYISVRYDSNEPPTVELQDINYANEITKTGIEAIDFTWPSTRMKEKNIILLFNAKNFFSTSLGKTMNTKVTITVGSTADRKVKKEIVYSVLRYNSLYTKEELAGEGNGTNSRKYMEVLEQSFWFVTNENGDVVYFESDPTPSEDPDDNANIQASRKAMIDIILGNNYDDPSQAPTCKNFPLITRNIIHEVETNDGWRIQYYGTYQDNLENMYNFMLDYIPTSRFGSSLAIGTLGFNGANYKYFQSTLIHNVDEENLFYPVKYESAQKGRVVVKPQEIEIRTGREAEFRLYQIIEDENQVQNLVEYANANHEWAGTPTYITYTYFNNGSLRQFSITDDNSCAAADNLFLHTSNRGTQYAYSYFGFPVNENNMYYVYFYPAVEYKNQMTNSSYDSWRTPLKISYTYVGFDLSTTKYVDEQNLVPSYIMIVEGLHPVAEIDSYIKYTYLTNDIVTTFDVRDIENNLAYVFPLEMAVWTYADNEHTAVSYLSEKSYPNYDDMSYDADNSINSYSFSISYFDSSYDAMTYVALSLDSTYYAYETISQPWIERSSIPQILTNRIKVSYTNTSLDINIGAYDQNANECWPAAYYPTYMLVHYYSENVTEPLPDPNIRFAEYNNAVIEGNADIVRMYSYYIQFENKKNDNDTYDEYSYDIQLIGDGTGINSESNIGLVGYGSEYSPNASHFIEMPNNRLVIAYSYNYDAKIPSRCIGYYIADDFVAPPVLGDKYLNFGKSINGNYTIGWSYTYITNKSRMRLDQVNGSYVGNSQQAYINVNNATISYWCSYNLIHEHKPITPGISGDMLAFECIAYGNALYQYNYSFVDPYTDIMFTNIDNMISYTEGPAGPSKSNFKLKIDSSYIGNFINTESKRPKVSIDFTYTRNSNGNYTIYNKTISEYKPADSSKEYLVFDEINNYAYISFESSTNKPKYFEYNDIIKLSVSYANTQKINTLGKDSRLQNIGQREITTISYSRDRFYQVSSINTINYAYNYTYQYMYDSTTSAINNTEQGQSGSKGGGSGTKAGTTQNSDYLAGFNAGFADGVSGASQQYDNDTEDPGNSGYTSWTDWRDGYIAGYNSGRTTYNNNNSNGSTNITVPMSQMMTKTISYTIPIRWETTLEDITPVVQKIMSIPVYMLASKSANVDISRTGAHLDNSFNKAIRFDIFGQDNKRYLSITGDGVNWNMNDENNDSLESSLQTVLDTYSVCRVEMATSSIKVDKGSFIQDANEGQQQRKVGGNDYDFGNFQTKNITYVTLPKFGKFYDDANYSMSYYAGFNIPYFKGQVFDAYLNPYLYDFEIPSNKAKNLGTVYFKLKYKVSDNNIIDIMTHSFDIDKIYNLPYVPEPMPYLAPVEDEYVALRGAAPTPVGATAAPSTKAEYIYAYNDLGLEVKIQSLILGTVSDKNPDLAAWTQLERIHEIDPVAYQSTMKAMVGIPENPREEEHLAYFGISWTNDEATSYSINVSAEAEKADIILDSTRISAYMYNPSINNNANAHAYWCSDWNEDIDGNIDFRLCYIGKYVPEKINENTNNIEPARYDIWPNGEFKYDLPNILYDINTYISYMDPRYMDVKITDRNIYMLDFIEEPDSSRI